MSGEETRSILDEIRADLADDPKGLAEFDRVTDVLTALLKVPHSAISPTPPYPGDPS